MMIFEHNYSKSYRNRNIMHHMKKSKGDDVTPLVSVVVPVYNDSEYFELALRSLLHQTYKNLEILVIDDGSQDEKHVLRIVQKYNFDRIKYFRKENGGVSTALNLAVNNATGTYFTWLSHDDLYDLDKIERQVDSLIGTANVNVVSYTGYRVINEKGHVLSSIVIQDVLDKCFSPLGPIERGIIAGCTVMMNLEFMREIGTFNESLRYVQDYDFWLRLWKAGAKFSLIDRPLVSVRVHANQTGSLQNTFAENFILWNKIADIWCEEVSRSGSIEEILNQIELFSTFCEEEKLEGALFALTRFRSRILNQYKVTIVIPVRGRLHLITRAICSVIQQSHKNLEILVILDNKDQDLDSKSKSYLVHEFGEKVSVLVNDGPSGPSSARNTGLEVATGDYVAFLDSDDVFLPEKIEKQLTHMIQKNLSFSHTSYLRKSEFKSAVDKVDTSHHVGAGQIGYILSFGCGIATPTVMIKRQVLENQSIRYDQSKRYGEDIFFYIDVLDQVSELGHVDEYLSMVYVNSASSANNPIAQSAHARDMEDLRRGKDLSRSHISAKESTFARRRRSSRMRKFLPLFRLAGRILIKVNGALGRPQVVRNNYFLQRLKRFLLR